MGINAVVIGANEEAIFSIHLAHRYGLHVDALDGNAAAAGMAAADAAHHVDINDLRAVYEITDRIQPAVVLPAPIGHCLTTIGAVNDRYGLVGVSGEAAEICTDKRLFHMRLAGAGLRDAQQVLLTAGSSYTEAAAALAPLSRYPVVVKPRYGSGSRGVEVCADREELERLLRRRLCTGSRPLEEDYVAESCIPGPEYGIDGAYVGGEFRMVLLRRKRNTPPPYRQCIGYESILPEEDPAFYAKCVHLMQKMGRVIGFGNCVMHADLIRRTDLREEEPFVIETSARPSGHHLSDLFTPLAAGVTLTEDFLKLAVPELCPAGAAQERERLFRPGRVRKLRIRYYDLPPGRVMAIPEEETVRRIPGVLDYVCRIREGDLLGKVQDGASVMGRGYYILEGADEKELDAAEREVCRGFRITGAE